MIGVSVFKVFLDSAVLGFSKGTLEILTYSIGVRPLTLGCDEAFGLVTTSLTSIPKFSSPPVVLIHLSGITVVSTGKFSKGLPDGYTELLG